MKAVFKIETLDGAVSEARVLPIDSVMFERKFPGVDGDNLTNEQGLRFAHSVFVRQDGVDANFDAWLATLADFASEEASSPLDPPSNGSQPSPPVPE